MEHVKKPWYSVLYFQVIVAIILGIIVGYVWPAFGTSLKPLGDGFIKLVKMMIAPVIFCTVVSGISAMTDMKKVGRVGGKALLYFEVISTFALIIGLIVGEVIRPGDGMNVDPKTLDPKAVATYVDKAAKDNVADHILGIIPDTYLSALSGGDLLQVLLVAILTGFAIAHLGDYGKPATAVIERLSKIFFRIIHMVVRLAPIGAFGAMAFTIGKYGVAALINLGMLIGSFYLTSLLFVLVVLGIVGWLCGFSILRFLNYIKAELLIVLGTSSSETVLPQMMEKMERLGCARPVVGLVIPSGYSFNLDGTNIYMTLATLFLAQATNTHLTFTHLVTILLVAMLTSKGASGVTGAGFITLAATLAVVPDIPIVSLTLLVGIDRFMSECRALTNLVGNGVATIAISKWEKELDVDKMRSELAHGPTAA